MAASQWRSEMSWGTPEMSCGSLGLWGGFGSPWVRERGSGFRGRRVGLKAFSTQPNLTETKV